MKCDVRAQTHVLRGEREDAVVLASFSAAGWYRFAPTRCGRSHHMTSRACAPHGASRCHPLSKFHRFCVNSGCRSSSRFPIRFRDSPPCAIDPSIGHSNSRPRGESQNHRRHSTKSQNCWRHSTRRSQHKMWHLVTTCPTFHTRRGQPTPTRHPNRWGTAAMSSGNFGLCDSC